MGNSFDKIQAKDISRILERELKRVLVIDGTPGPRVEQARREVEEECRRKYADSRLRRNEYEANTIRAERRNIANDYEEPERLPPIKSPPRLGRLELKPETRAEVDRIVAERPKRAL